MKNTIILGNGNVGMFPTKLQGAPSRIDGEIALVFVELPVVKGIGEFSTAEEVGMEGGLTIDDERICGMHVFYNEESIDNLIDALNDTKKMMKEYRCLTSVEGDKQELAP
jgi:hypothetical protein